MKTSLRLIRRTGLKYGISGGIITVLFMFLIHKMGSNILDPSFSLMTVLLIVLLVIFAIAEYRQRDQEIKFWKNMTVALLIYLIIAVCSSACIYVMVKYVDPALLSNYVQDRVAMMTENKDTFIDRFGQETFELTVEKVKNTRLRHIVLDRFIRDMMGGLFVGIVISAVYHFIYNRKSFINPKPE